MNESPWTDDAPQRAANGRRCRSSTRARSSARTSTLPQESRAPAQPAVARSPTRPGGHQNRQADVPAHRAVEDEKGERVGTVVEWGDRTVEVATEKEVAAVVGAANQGDFTRRLGRRQGGLLPEAGGRDEPADGDVVGGVGGGCSGAGCAGEGGPDGDRSATTTKGRSGS